MAKLFSIFFGNFASSNHLASKKFIFTCDSLPEQGFHRATVSANLKVFPTSNIEIKHEEYFKIVHYKHYNKITIVI